MDIDMTTMSKRTYLPGVNDWSVAASVYDYMETHYGTWVNDLTLLDYLLESGRKVTRSAVGKAIKRLCANSEINPPVEVRYDEYGGVEWRVSHRAYLEVAS